MDTRTTSVDFYPGGKTPVTAGGGITSGETGGASGEPMVPVTKVEQLPEHYRESDMRSKINELARVISGGVAAIMAMVSLTLGAEPVKVLGAKKDALWNDDFVVTNVVADFAGFATTNTVTGATNALAATFVQGLEVATNAVLQTGAKEIAAATNALSQSVDERLKASTNGSFSASLLEPYAKRTWVEAQGFIKSDEARSVIDNAIAGRDDQAAYRLMSPDRLQWIDATGVCWRVQSHIDYFVDGNIVVYGEPNQKRFTDERGSEVWLKEETEDEWTWAGKIVLNEIELEDGDVIALYEGRSNKKDYYVELGFKEYLSENRDYGQPTIYMHYEKIETNAVNRVAFTNDVSSDVSKEADLLAFYYPGGNVTSMDQITTNGIEYAVGEDGGAYVSDYVKGSIESLENIVLPWKVSIDGKEYEVTAIGRGAFDCSRYGYSGELSFKTIIAPTTVKNIGGYAFYSYGHLTSASFPSVTNINTYSFYGNTSLTSISLPSLKNIGMSSFSYCTELKSISLQSARTMDGYAFANCSSLATVSLPAITNIGSEAFENCEMLTSVYCPLVETVGDWAFYYTGIRNLDIPFAVELGDHAFRSCALDHISLPKVCKIGQGAFANCTRLKSIYIPSVTEIDSEAFDEDGSLTTVDFGSSPKLDVPSLDSRAFNLFFFKVIIPLGMYDEWISADVWRDLYADGVKFEGYASTEQLKRLPTHETVTNVARAVSNSFWDEKNEVLWRMEFRDGEPMFVPVTNENVKATGGVL